MTALHSRRAFLAAAGSAAGLAGVGVADATPTTETTTATDRPAETGTTASETPAPPDPTGDYPTVGVDAARTGFDPDERGPPGPAKPWWCAGAGGSNRLTPLAVVGGTVFTGSPSRGLRALDAATGEVRRRADLETESDDDAPGFGLGAGVGAAASVAGVGAFPTTVAYLSTGGHNNRGVSTMSVHERDGGGRRCPRCEAELVQKASESGVFVCTNCGGSQLR